jgi:hypothetical protein
MRSIVIVSAFVLLVFLSFIVGVQFFAAPNSPIRETQAMVIQIGANAWTFARPLLQLIVILLVLEWFTHRFGFKAGGKDLLHGSVQTFIAVLVVASFCIAALANIPGADTLKDITLVVVGFYFGSTRKPGELGNNAPENQPGAGQKPSDSTVVD